LALAHIPVGSQATSERDFAAFDIASAGGVNGLSRAKLIGKGIDPAGTQGIELGSALGYQGVSVVHKKSGVLIKHTSGSSAKLYRLSKKTLFTWRGFCSINALVHEQNRENHLDHRACGGHVYFFGLVLLEL
jgi:hypothetical protein